MTPTPERQAETPTREAQEDAKFLRYFAAGVTYNDTTAEAEAKHRLHEVAMRIETGYYAARSFKSGVHVGSGMERAALAARPADPVEPRHPDAGILEVHYRQSHRVDMPQEFYDTLTSLCALVGPKNRQAFDSLLSKFVDHISAVVNATPAEPSVRAALEELVACRDEMLKGPRRNNLPLYLRSDRAWQAARTALQAAPLEPAEMHKETKG